MNYTYFFGLCLLLWACQQPTSSRNTSGESRPNILIAISDDQSFSHVSILGTQEIQTPHFDRIAREGVWFVNAFAASPGCSPSRAALLTGKHTWQLGAAGTHASHFDTAHVVFPDLLEAAGYKIGFTGKGWGPGNWKISGRTRNPAGPEWSDNQLESPEGISDKDYASNFEAFLGEKPADQPFYFWFGGHEPHRVFKKGIGKEMGKNTDAIKVPGFLPDEEEIRSDVADYYVEIEWFDQQLGKMIEALESRGELENTLIIVTSDNGMAFPRAKANLYEYGFHVPLAIRWGNRVPGNYIAQDLVGFVDLAPTIVEAAQIPTSSHPPMVGNSLFGILTQQETYDRKGLHQAVYAGRERHSSSRYHSLGYPQRALRTSEYLYIHNFRPERWPAGAPQKYGDTNYPTKKDLLERKLGPEDGGYHDIDACPSLDFLLSTARVGQTSYLQLAVGQRPAEELFNIVEDPACLNDLSQRPEFSKIKDSLRSALFTHLETTQDPRVLDGGDIWETYPRYSGLREFPTPSWAIEHPERVPMQAWLSKEAN